MTKEIDKQLDDKEKKLRKKIEKQVENKKYQDKITPIQQSLLKITLANMVNGRRRNVR